MSYSAYRCHTISYGGNEFKRAKNDLYGEDVQEAILSVPERRDDAQTVISDKLKRGAMLEVPTVPRRVEMASWDLGGLQFFFQHSPITFPKIYTRDSLRNGPGHFVSLLQNCRA